MNSLIFFAVLSLTISLAYIVVPFVLNRLSNNKYVMQTQQIIQKILWIYTALLPTVFIIIIRFNPEHFGNSIYIIIYLLLIVLPLVIQLLSIFYLRKTKLNKTKGKVLNIKKLNKDFHSNKLMEFFVTLILPFITVSDKIKDVYTIGLVLLIIIMVFWKLKIFYLNLPILLFYYIYEVTLSDNNDYYLITNEKDITVNKEYRIITYNKNLKIAVLIPI